MMDKTFDPSAVEARISTRWEEAEAFKAGREDRKGAVPYTIVIPPPNVTGSLHMGHALNNTIQDILCRFERMRGKDVLWQPGMDHAGIATQMVVERQLAERQIQRRDLGRDEFVRRVWEWKEESGGTIVRQLKRLGASCDWSRERFTMDEGLSRAVLKVFVDLYKQGLMYKDKRLVNWDPKFQTAISDLEVQQVEVKGNLWHIRYAIEGMPDRFITVATTRPETMLGDVAVAVHPDDERYKDLVGQFAILPLVGRRIPIVADEYSDPEKGTGAVKITPAHDFNDFEVGTPPQAAAHQHLRHRGSTCARRQRGLPGRPESDRRPRGRARPRRSRPFRGAQAHRRHAGGARAARADRAACSHGPARRPLERGDRALPHGPVVREREAARRAGARRGAPGQDQVRAGELGEDLFPVAREHRALVRLAPALVGPPDSRLV